MAAIVGIDARVDLCTDFSNGNENLWVWTQLPERNEFSISIKVDVAEHKTFVATLDKAWINKARTWMSWSGSLQGYLDDSNDTIFNTVKTGQTVMLRFYDSQRSMTKYWQGPAVLTSVEHGTGTDDFSTLNVDFEGQGELKRTNS